ncbi:MAG TPA: thiamine pyrophosphate-binding protein [Gemmataceae bacterium]|nr:thiamine pyrophosphate-binding protein [Gemmataceae bacterium]
MIRVAEYIARALADRGARHVFLVTGGGAMFLNDAFGHEPRLTCICNHHEQACAMAAEGYARVTGTPGVVNVTTGPGGINALNGVFGAWTDSIPLLVVSGQVKRETCVGWYDRPRLRQLGDQEADIVRIVQSVTKYAVFVKDPKTIRYHLEKAWHLASAGRPGPCWLDVPIDVQSAMIEPDELPGYDPAEDAVAWDVAQLREQCREVLSRLQNAVRPVVMIGTGVRLAGGIDAFRELIDRLGVPVTTTWTAHDLLPSNHRLHCGRPGTIGDRAGNFTVQNADVLLVIGSRLNIRQVSYNWKTFARHAYKIQVDVDAEELNKPTVKPDLPIHCDARLFLEEMNRQAAGFDRARHAGWLSWCRQRVTQYPVVTDRHRTSKGRINPYHFIDVLFRRLHGDDVVVCGDGSACVVTFQAAWIADGLRLWCNSGCASMGYDLPAAVGAAVARGGRRVICLAGDGSIQMNIQELQTVAHHQLPIKIFVLNNDGYMSIRQSQMAFFKRRIGEGPTSGLSFPDMSRVAQAYGLPTVRIERGDLAAAVEYVLGADGSLLADVLLDPEQVFEPKLSAKQLPGGAIVSPPLEDMAPFLHQDELRANLLVPEAA